MCDISTVKQVLRQKFAPTAKHPSATATNAASIAIRDTKMSL